ncbi:MAG TPA: RNA 2',3'-cyclic phosphodiesterase [Candidatus Dormibacteraeota bacterium]|nr:RNA 2',3'-cyclic phosphodiesterase [Candidatus Dormibacteraeota bacterium]
MRAAPTLFLALELPASLRRHLAIRLGQLGALDPRIRPVRADGLHLTLRFLGRMDAETETSIREAAGRVAQKTQAFGLELHGLGAFSQGAHPQVIWAAVRQGQSELGQLAEGLAAALAAAGWPPEPRPFVAHCTLARVPGGLGATAQAKLVDLGRRAGAEPPLPMRATALALLESVVVRGEPNRYPSRAGWSFQDG